MTLNLHTVTSTVASRYSRGEASFSRHHSDQAPAPSPRLRSWGRDLLDGGIALVALVLVLKLLGVV